MGVFDAKLAFEFGKRAETKRMPINATWLSVRFIPRFFITK